MIVVVLPKYVNFIGSQKNKLCVQWLSMNTALCLYKEVGETPLMCLNRLRATHSEYRDSVLSYAGRLDPMAEGLLLVMVDDANQEREKYLGLDKEYTCDILFDVATDTYDVLGKIRDFSNKNTILDMNRINAAIQQFVGTREQQYPFYSSKPVSGKPLFKWAREGKMADLMPPGREITIFKITVNEVITMSKQAVADHIYGKISKISGDFRQDEIKDDWDRYFSFINKENYVVARISLHCSSGTYVRMLADQLGKKLGTCALAMDIRRTKIGGFCLDQAIR